MSERAPRKFLKRVSANLVAAELGDGGVFRRTRYVTASEQDVEARVTVREPGVLRLCVGRPEAEDLSMGTGMIDLSPEEADHLAAVLVRIAGLQRLEGPGDA